MAIDQTFFDVFSSYFIADLLDVRDRNQLEENTDILTSALQRRGLDTQKLKADLSQFLNEWDPKTVQRFIKASNVNWFANEQTEQALRYVVTQILRYLEQ